MPVVCICPENHSLAGRKELCLNDLKEERLVLFAPPRGALSIAQLQGRLMGDRPPSEFYFCESSEAITVLVTSGYGISVLPDFLVPDTPLISKIPLTDTEPLSFGVYYKSVQGNPALKEFINCARKNFA